MSITTTNAALFAAAAALAAVVAIAPTAGADPSGCAASKPGCSIVPGMHDGVVGQSCPTPARFAYGVDASGGLMECTGLSGQQSGTWRTLHSHLAGVRPVGDPCASGQMAQAPDGQPLWCGPTGWTVVETMLNGSIG
jgi:hypothetical protein